MSKNRNPTHPRQECGGDPVGVAAGTCPERVATEEREVKSITMKRKNIDLTAEDKYGHWWIEVGDEESYGWWPKEQVGLGGTLGGTDGELNGQSTFGGTATMDPHHGDDAEQEFHPVVAPDDTRTDDEVTECLRDYAQSYSGEWRWTLGGGQNCHSFQKSAMKHCGLEEP